MFTPNAPQGELFNQLAQRAAPGTGGNAQFMGGTPSQGAPKGGPPTTTQFGYMGGGLMDKMMPGSGAQPPMPIGTGMPGQMGGSVGGPQPDMPIQTVPPMQGGNIGGGQPQMPISNRPPMPGGGTIGRNPTGY